MNADYLIENKVSEKSFEDIVYNWLIEGDYTPNDIIENIVTDKNLLYLPIIFYKMKYSGHCNASLGYQRAEDYYEWDNINKRQIRRTRYVTDWHPYSQNVSGQTSISVFAGAENLNAIAKFVEDMGWESTDLINFDSSLNRYKDVTFKFEFTIEEGWKLKGYKKSFESASEQTYNQLPSKLVNSLNLNIDFEKVFVTSIMVPYWLFSYEYESKRYFVTVDGNSPKRVFGTKPEDTKRKNKVSTYRWVGWLSGFSIITIIIYLYFDKSFDNFDLNMNSLGIIIVGLILTGIIVENAVTNIKTISKKRREEKLKQKNR